MRAAAILGLGCSVRDLKPFQKGSSVEWRLGMPLAAEDADVILVFGGDGTIHRHLGQLVKLNLPVLVVPAGSGNDFARALGLGRVRNSLAAWQRFRIAGRNVHTIDLGRIRELGAASSPDSEPATQYFASVAGVGLDSQVARRASQLPRWLRAHGGYALTLATLLFTFRPFPLRLQAARETSNPGDAAGEGRSNHSAMLAAFANTPLYGGGMKIAPRARMDDGLLDVCVVGAVDPFKLFSMFPTVYRGRHLKIAEVDYFQTPRVRVETERALDVYADGEFVCRTPVEISTAGGAFKIVTAGD
jgi:diacylglycerol kinase (ATP)